MRALELFYEGRDLHPCEQLGLSGVGQSVLRSWEVVCNAWVASIAQGLGFRSLG